MKSGWCLKQSVQATILLQAITGCTSWAKKKEQKCDLDLTKRDVQLQLFQDKAGST